MRRALRFCSSNIFLTRPSTNETMVAIRESTAPTRGQYVNTHTHTHTHACFHTHTHTHKERERRTRGSGQRVELLRRHDLDNERGDIEVNSACETCTHT